MFHFFWDTWYINRLTLFKILTSFYSHVYTCISKGMSITLLKHHQHSEGIQPGNFSLFSSGILLHKEAKGSIKNPPNSTGVPSNSTGKIWKIFQCNAELFQQNNSIFQQDLPKNPPRFQWSTTQIPLEKWTHFQVESEHYSNSSGTEEFNSLWNPRKMPAVFQWNSR